MKLGRYIDLTGTKHGYLTVEKFSRKIKSQNYWICVCDCGNTTEVSTSNLTSGSTKSCGCLRKQTAIVNGKKATKHGLRRTRIYNIYRGMIARCTNANCANYDRYGGRGVTICAEWHNKENGFINFYNWAMANGYSENLSIDRVNNDMGYFANNCRWVSAKVQANNVSTNKMISYKGREMTVSQWADVIGMKRKTLEKRLNCYGWDTQRAIETPVNHYGS